MIEREPSLQAHFGLTTTPFTREIAVDKQWKHGQYQDVAQALLSCVEMRQSVALIAPAGSGKTQVLRALCKSLPTARYRVHYVHVTGLSKRDFCREVATSLGLRPAGHFASLVRQIQTHQQTLLDDRALRPVLIIDEAHDLRLEVLAVLRVLTNFEMDSRLVVSVVLAGQNSLREKLRQDSMTCIRGRLAHYASLQLLSRDETRDYMLHRLKMAGAHRVIYAEPAHDAVYECTRGNLRAIDQLSLKSLQVAARQQAERVDVAHVVEAREMVAP